MIFFPASLLEGRLYGRSWTMTRVPTSFPFSSVIIRSFLRASLKAMASRIFVLVILPSFGDHPPS